VKKPAKKAVATKAGAKAGVKTAAKPPKKPATKAKATPTKAKKPASKAKPKAAKVHFNFMPKGNTVYIRQVEDLNTDNFRVKIVMKILNYIWSYTKLLCMCM